MIKHILKLLATSSIMMIPFSANAQVQEPGEAGAARPFQFQGLVMSMPVDFQGPELHEHLPLGVSGALFTKSRAGNKGVLAMMVEKLPILPDQTLDDEKKEFSYASKCVTLFLRTSSPAGEGKIIEAAEEVVIDGKHAARAHFSGNSAGTDVNGFAYCVIHGDKVYAMRVVEWGEVPSDDLNAAAHVFERAKITSDGANTH